MDGKAYAAFGLGVRTPCLLLEGQYTCSILPYWNTKSTDYMFSLYASNLPDLQPKNLRRM